jgi:cytochrome P450
MDPEIFSKPENSKGLSFVDAASNYHTGEKNKKAPSTAFAAVHSSIMGFGYGRHGCPGRFFALAEIRLSWCTCWRIMESFKYFT